MEESKEEIVELIKAMTPGEKQHFKRLYSGNFEFVKLFDYINFKKNIENKKALQYLTKKNGKAVLSNKYTAGYLSVIKKYLQKKLIDSLRRQTSTKRLHHDILTHTINANILLEKGLFNLAKEELAQARKKTQNGVFSFEQMNILNTENTINWHEFYHSKSIKSLNQQSDQRIRLAKELLLDAIYSKILNQLNYHYYNLDLKQYLKVLAAKPELQKEMEPEGLEVNSLFHWINGSLAQYNLEEERAMFHYQKSMELWLASPEYTRRHIHKYLAFCFSYLRAIHKFQYARQTANTVTYHHKVRKVLGQDILTLDQKELFHFFGLLFKLSKFKVEKRYYDIIVLAPNVSDLKSNRPTLQFIRIALHYYISFAFFKLKKYNKALTWLNPILVTEDIHLNRNLEFAADLVTLFTLVHYELENYKFLNYDLAKKEQILKKIDRYDPLRAHFFLSMRNLVKQKMTDKVKIDLSETLLFLKEKEGDPSFNQLGVQLFSFQNWLQKEIDQEA